MFISHSKHLSEVSWQMELELFVLVFFFLNKRTHIDD